MNDKKDLINANGEIVNADIIAFAENTVTNKRYIYYTLNETVGVGPSGTVKIYVSKVKQNDPSLDAPITDEDWDMLKAVMSDSIKGTASENIKYLPLEELKDNTSVSDRAIAMPTSYDYINKQRGVYAQAVANAMTTISEPVVQATEEAPVTPLSPEIQEPVMSEPTPVAPQSPVPAVEPVTPIESQIVQETPPVKEDSTVRPLEPIDLAEIEARYAKMFEEIDNLKAKELEAAKRYNATLELTNMHSEQHATYVKNDMKENIQTINEPVVPPMPTIEPATISNPQSVEPTPITPIVPEPTPIMATEASANIETNWFDMPSN